MHITELSAMAHASQPTAFDATPAFVHPYSVPVPFGPHTLQAAPHGRALIKKHASAWKKIVEMSKNGLKIQALQRVSELAETPEQRDQAAIDMVDLTDGIMDAGFELQCDIARDCLLICHPTLTQDYFDLYADRVNVPMICAAAQGNLEAARAQAKNALASPSGT
jgi:hypothetical protein